MLNRLMLLGVLVLVGLAAACPKPGGEGEEQAQPAPEQPKVIVVKANPISTIEKMVNALNVHDREAYAMLIHPESPNFDELTARFEQFDPAVKQMALEDVSVESQEGTEATINYDFATEYTDGATKAEFETGRFTLHFVGEQWVIWSNQIRTGGPS